MKYLKKHYKFILCLTFIILSYNLYFIFLLDQVNLQLLLYLDLLILVFLIFYFGIDFYNYSRSQKELNNYLNSDNYICNESLYFEDKEILEHDFNLFQEQLNHQMMINQDQVNFVTKWCHEIKLPLSTAGLLIENIDDPNLKSQMKEQLEKMKLYLNSALVGCKVQGNFDDLHITKVRLKDCVNTSIKNNRYFLIKNHIELQINLNDEYVYSDEQWLVYIIDQIIANAIKYIRDNPKIMIYSKTNDNEVKLYIKDFGEGIKDYDLPRIFDQGYVGSNHHNGQYKSTGIGLYMVKLMIQKLDHRIEVSSSYQKETCFCITFKNNEHFFNL